MSLNGDEDKADPMTCNQEDTFNMVSTQRLMTGFSLPKSERIIDSSSIRRSAASCSALDQMF